MLSLHERLDKLEGSKTDERAKIEEEIKKTDAIIDELVYKFYGISDEEKKIIEGT
jgi:type II restriction/modification system DNA methylase subunit YeeA